MYKHTFWGFALLAFLVGGAIWIISAVPMQKGIDLQGGTELRYRLDLSRIEGDRAKVADEVKDIISKRLDAYGLKEISIAARGEDEQGAGAAGDPGEPNAVPAAGGLALLAGAERFFRLAVGALVDGLLPPPDGVNGAGSVCRAPCSTGRSVSRRRAVAVWPDSSSSR